MNAEYITGLWAGLDSFSLGVQSMSTLYPRRTERLSHASNSKSIEAAVAPPPFQPDVDNFGIASDFSSQRFSPFPGIHLAGVARDSARDIVSHSILGDSPGFANGQPDLFASASLILPKCLVNHESVLLQLWSKLGEGAKEVYPNKRTSLA